MALQKGWPLGLRLLNGRNGDFSGSVSFSRISTILTASPTPSTESSSDLDSQLPRTLKEINQGKNGGTLKGQQKESQAEDLIWLFSLCSKLTTDAVSVNVAPSLGHYLVAERRAESTHRRNNQCSTIYGPNDFFPIRESNSLFVGGQGAHSSSTSLGEDCGREPNKVLDQSNGYAAPIICCVCR
ncbi:hypothetical protein JHK82_050446 [Glycine max]|nr:hypothetical protein JHK86_050292 [Glycine max]KAG4936168.1 hypothetical protein JHK85_051087 [Glycine max]KAG5091668.1 hypothetical protein JHK82_050446 [Glycine max]KAG5094766.1 hypothetical protein JHK84_050354 [Glycine max]